MSGSSDSSDDPKIGPRAVRLGQVWEAANMLSAADRFLSADVPPPSHPRSKSRLVVPCCLRLSLAIAISSVIVFGQLRVADIWHLPADDHLWTRLNRAASALPGSRRSAADRPVSSWDDGGTRTARLGDLRSGRRRDRHYHRLAGWNGGFNRC